MKKFNLIIKEDTKKKRLEKVIEMLEKKEKMK